MLKYIASLSIVVCSCLPAMANVDPCSTKMDEFQAFLMDNAAAMAGFKQYGGVSSLVKRARTNDFGNYTADDVRVIKLMPEVYENYMRVVDSKFAGYDGFRVLCRVSYVFNPEALRDFVEKIRPGSSAVEDFQQMLKVYHDVQRFSPGGVVVAAKTYSLEGDIIRLVSDN